MTPHLRGHVRAYVDRALPPAILHMYDRHLVCCVACRAAADQERRIVASLRSASGHVPGSLRSSLIGLATMPIPSPEPEHASRIPLGPLATLAPRGSRPAAAPLAREPVPTVPPTAPALHRSPMRAAVVASLAAGASVAAAWGLAISPLPGGGRAPVARIPSGVASFGAATFSPVVEGAGRSAAPTRRIDQTTAGSSSPVWLVQPVQATVRSDVTGPVPISLVSSAESGP